MFRILNSNVLKLMTLFLISSAGSLGVEIVFGVERVSRGCINENDRISLMCKTTSHTSSTQKRNLSAVDYEYSAAYAMNCCSDGDFCNDGEFPELPHVNDLGMILIVHS